MTGEENWMDGIIGPDTIRVAGAPVAKPRPSINLVGATQEDDPANDQTNITIHANVSTPGSNGQILTGNGSGGFGTPLSQINLASQVTGTLPTGNQAAQTMGGDCSGTTAICSVDKIKGVTVSGTPLAGKSLRCTSGTAASWGPVDLSDTTNAVTGTLPGTSVGVAVGGVTPSAGAMSSSDKTKLDGIQTQGAPVALVGAGSTNIDWSQSQTFTKTIAANTTLTMSNVVVGGQVSVEITAGAGNTVTFTNPSGFTITWPGGTQPTQTSGKTDVYTFLATSSSTIRALVAQNY